jgi:hypothetical protein
MRLAELTETDGEALTTLRGGIEGRNQDGSMTLRR